MDTAHMLDEAITGCIDRSRGVSSSAQKMAVWGLPLVAVAKAHQLSDPFLSHLEARGIDDTDALRSVAASLIGTLLLGLAGGRQFEAALFGDVTEPTEQAADVDPDELFEQALTAALETLEVTGGMPDFDPQAADYVMRRLSGGLTEGALARHEQLAPAMAEISQMVQGFLLVGLMTGRRYEQALSRLSA